MEKQQENILYFLVVIIVLLIGIFVTSAFIMSHLKDINNTLSMFIEDTISEAANPTSTDQNKEQSVSSKEPNPPLKEMGLLTTIDTKKNTIIVGYTPISSQHEDFKRIDLYGVIPVNHLTEYSELKSLMGKGQTKIQIVLRTPNKASVKLKNNTNEEIDLAEWLVGKGLAVPSNECNQQVATDKQRLCSLLSSAEKYAKENKLGVWE